MHQFQIHPLFGGDLGLFTITNSTLWMAIAILAISALLILGTRGRNVVPTRLQSVAEVLYGFIRQMCVDVLGQEGLKFFPYIFTIFMFILFSNLLRLIPYSFTTTSHVAVTGVMAIGVFLTVIIIVAIIVALVVVFVISKFFNLWLQARVSGAPVSFGSLIGMWFRKVNTNTIVLSRIQAVKAGIEVSTNQLETHYLSRGNVPRVINALIAASRAKIELPWDTACAIDLAGRDILEAGKPHGVQRCPGERASLRGVSRRCGVTERLIPGKILQCRQRALDAGLVTQIEQ